MLTNKLSAAQVIERNRRFTFVAAVEALRAPTIHETLCGHDAAWPGRSSAKHRDHSVREGQRAVAKALAAKKRDEVRAARAARRAATSDVKGQPTPKRPRPVAKKSAVQS